MLGRRRPHTRQERSNPRATKTRVHAGACAWLWRRRPRRQVGTPRRLLRGRAGKQTAALCLHRRTALRRETHELRIHTTRRGGSKARRCERGAAPARRGRGAPGTNGSEGRSEPPGATPGCSVSTKPGQEGVWGRRNCSVPCRVMALRCVKIITLHTKIKKAIYYMMIKNQMNKRCSQDTFRAVFAGAGLALWSELSHSGGRRSPLGDPSRPGTALRMRPAAGPVGATARGSLRGEGGSATVGRERAICKESPRKARCPPVLGQRAEVGGEGETWSALPGPLSPPQQDSRGRSHRAAPSS